MKSLEITNKLYEDIKELCDYYLSREWNLEKEKFCSKICKNMCDLIETLQKDKQDLEVLEIIKNKNVDLKMFKRLYKEEYMPTLSCNRFLYVYNWTRGLGESELTMEELLKLKQWLEDNE